VLVVELGHVTDMFRRDGMTKMVNQIDVRVTILLASLGRSRPIGTDVFVSFSTLCGRRSRILWRLR
jgi:hypothetical protein